MSKSISLTGDQIVQGNINTLLQVYEYKYYPQEGDLIPKVALYLYLRKKEENAINYAKRSMYFSSLPQLRQFIRDSIKAYFHLLGHRVKPFKKSVHEYRIEMLKGLLEDISEMQREVWRSNKPH